MKELQTILGTEIPITTRGIFYVCFFDRKRITVVQEALYDSAFDALNVYANTPNPESQLVTGKTYDELIINMHKLHKNMKDPAWLADLADCI